MNASTFASMFVSNDINRVANEISIWREGKGFYTPNSIESPTKAEAMLGKLMLVVSEIAEATEAVRDLDTEHFIEELADVFIRLLDICGTMEIDISNSIKDKMTTNQTRPIRHNRKINL